jgi:ribonuclease VapC
VILSRKGQAGRIAFEALCQELGLRVASFNREQAELALAAWEQFGKGRHPAALNLGDCCSYALAKSTGFALLCKGNDFPRTDLELLAY